MAAVSSKKKVETAITTLLNVRRGAEAIDFYTRAFGATTLSRMDAPDGTVVAHLAIGKRRCFNGGHWRIRPTPHRSESLGKCG